MKALCIAPFLLLVCPLLSSQDGGPGKTIVRLKDPSGAHCIDGSKEQVTLLLKRIWTEKTSGIFTEDNKAGAIVRTDLDNGDAKAHIPSVNFASIADDRHGHVSLALEYAIMKRFVLHQANSETSNVNVDVYLAKTRGRNTFGDIIDVAGKALAQLPVPANPYTTTAQQFLKFANDSIDKATADDIENLIAQINLNFADRQIDDLSVCHSRGDEFTGGAAVLLSTGEENAALIPIQDADKNYCFSYSSQSVFGLTAVKMPDNHVCPTDATQYSEVPNDYVLFILNAETVAPPHALQSVVTRARTQHKESQKRCGFFGIPSEICQ
jgi:hypothetical protein